MDQNVDTAPKLTFTSVWTIFEKIHELRWTLHLAMVVLFADLVLVCCRKQGIIHWSISADQLMANAGLLITGVLAFGILMSLVMPLIGFVFRSLLWALILPFTEINKTDDPHDDGKVWPYELQDHALKKGDKLLLDLWEAHQRKKWDQSLKKWAYGQMVFSVLVLAFLDFYLADWFGIKGTTVLQDLALLGKLGQFALLSGLLAGAAALRWAWFTKDAPDWINYPPLYEEIKERAKNSKNAMKNSNDSKTAGPDGPITPFTGSADK